MEREPWTRAPVEVSHRWEEGEGEPPVGGGWRRRDGMGTGTRGSAVSKKVVRWGRKSG